MRQLKSLPVGSLVPVTIYDWTLTCESTLTHHKKIGINFKKIYRLDNLRRNYSTASIQRVSPRADFVFSITPTGVSITNLALK